MRYGPDEPDATYVPHAYEEHGFDTGAITASQVAQVESLVTSAGQPFELSSFPEAQHSLHGTDPALCARTLLEWAAKLPTA